MKLYLGTDLLSKIIIFHSFARIIIDDEWQLLKSFAVDGIVTNDILMILKA